MKQIIIAMVLVGLPHAILLSYICYKLAEKTGLVCYLKTKYHQADVEEGPDNDPFPDRLQNPEKYEPDVQEHTTSGLI